MSDFFPENYQKPSSSWNYFKPAKGENRVRIITKPVIGFVDWDKTGEKQRPIRTKELQTAFDPNQKPKHFYAFGVLHEWEVKIWEITQSSIQDSIYALAKDEEWGEPTLYDLSITRTGESMETKYSVIPKPAKMLTDEQGEIIMNSPLNLEALFDWGNPFEVEAKEEEDETF